MKIMSKALMPRIVICLTLLSFAQWADSQTISWAGHTWKVTNGGMAGVAKGDPANVRIDGKGYLHLNITRRDGKWTASELFTAENLGFGTYQWIVEGNVYEMDPTTVLGLFPYGPDHHVGVDGENEIDIEFSQWNKTCHGCNADFTIYPSTGNRKHDGTSSWEDNFHVSGGRLTTARMEWTADRVVFTLMSGAQPIGKTSEVIKTESYSSTRTNIPQEALPVGINLWCFQKTPAASQQVIIRSFEFAAETAERDHPSPDASAAKGRAQR